MNRFVCMYDCMYVCLMYVYMSVCRSVTLFLEPLYSTAFTFYRYTYEI